MATYQLVRYEIRAEARADAERALHEHAARVRDSLPDESWTTYRDPDVPTRFVTFARGERGAVDTRAFAAIVQPFLASALDVMGCELVTSSDLQRRHRRR